MRRGAFIFAIQLYPQIRSSWMATASSHAPPACAEPARKIRTSPGIGFSPQAATALRIRGDRELTGTPDPINGFQSEVALAAIAQQDAPRVGTTVDCLVSTGDDALCLKRPYRLPCPGQCRRDREPCDGRPGAAVQYTRWRDWRTRHDSNVRPLPSEGNALSS
jgi:hypothetical protein